MVIGNLEGAFFKTKTTVLQNVSYSEVGNSDPHCSSQLFEKSVLSLTCSEPKWKICNFQVMNYGIGGSIVGHLDSIGKLLFWPRIRCMMLRTQKFRSCLSQHNVKILNLYIDVILSISFSPDNWQHACQNFWLLLYWPTDQYNNILPRQKYRVFN